MVVPGWQAVLPVGERHDVRVLTHQQLMGHPTALNQLMRTILQP